jgi:hypothetical protein
MAIKNKSTYTSKHLGKGVFSRQPKVTRKEN